MAPKRRPSRRTTARPSRTVESRGKYVYCVIRSEDALRFGAVGLGTVPAEVSTVHYKDIAAVVSDTPIEVFDATRENVLAHERVNEAVMRDHTVIPMSFGTVFKTRDDIIELLRGAYSAFIDVLLKMEDKVEFGLKVLWERDVAVASRANKPIGDKMIMNAAFLVSRDREQAFDAKVKAVGAKYAPLTFRYTGPWPPYNFVNIRLKLER